MTEAIAGRFRLTWAIEPVTSEYTKDWAINAEGQPALELYWGRRRWRHVASLWVRPGFGDRDPRVHMPYSAAKELLKVGPLKEHGIKWDVTWHTWDRDGIGGENAGEPNLCAALEVTVVRLLCQWYIPDVRAGEMYELLTSASALSKGWRDTHGLHNLRWTP